MGTFVGLDVSLKETSVCILDQEGTCVFEGKVASEPAAIVRLIRKRAPDLARVGLDRREITATEPRLIANGIANIGLVRTLIATGGQENGPFRACE